MTKEIGTLKELDVKPGDVVELEGCFGDNMTVIECPPRKGCFGDHWELDCEVGGLGLYSLDQKFRIVSRAPEPKATPPKLWKDMTPEEKGALLLAHHEGEVIECWQWLTNRWLVIKPSFDDDSAYRVKPEPVVETRTITSWGTLNQWLRDGDVSRVHESHCKYKITFNLIDGKPDCNSVKMEEI